MHILTNFSIIQTMCRIGLSAAGPAFRFQVERLVKALRADGDTKQARIIEELMTESDQQQTLKPSRLVKSGSESLPGEVLSSRVSPPVDRETGTPLGEIHFPSKAPWRPVLSEALSSAVSRLIQEWAHVDQLVAVGAAPPRTCMLFGKPGTGKTRLAYYIGDNLGLPVVLAKLDGLISSFLGTTARNMGTLFEFATRYRCLLLLDEFDALAKLRDDPQEVGEIKRVVNTILQNIDKRTNLSGFTLAITNHEGLLDPAVWRRFEVRIHVPNPGRPERQEILEHYFLPMILETSTLKFLAWLTDGMTGSDLETMAKSIKRFLTIHAGDNSSFVDALRAYALTHANAESSRTTEMALAPVQELARRLLNEPEAGLTQQEVGNLLNRDQATISRWLKNDSLSEQKGAVYAE